MANSNGWGDGASNNQIGWGQGANNNIGWGDSHAKSWSGATDIVGITTDADAQAFITAAAITDPTQQTAIDTLVKGMKADGIWTKMKAIYPFVGGTASTHKWNLKDPRDLDAAFRLVFSGGWTHSSNGATPNGTNGYADTFLIPSTSLTTTSGHLSTYSRSNTNVGFDMGADIQINAVISRFNNVFYANYGTYDANVANTDSRGHFITNRNSATKTTGFKNGNKVIDFTVTANLSSFQIAIGALRNSSSSVVQYSNKQTAFASIGNGLTDTEAANLYTRVQAFQTSLSRQV